MLGARNNSTEARMNISRFIVSETLGYDLGNEAGIRHNLEEGGGGQTEKKRGKGGRERETDEEKGR